MKNTTTLHPRPVAGSGPLGSELVALSSMLTRCQYQLVVTAAAFAESPEWILEGSPTPAHWLAAVADVEDCTAREWIRIGKALTVLPVTATHPLLPPVVISVPVSPPLVNLHSPSQLVAVKCLCLVMRKSASPRTTANRRSS